MNKSGNYSTERLRDLVLQADNLDDFKLEILSLLPSEREAWKTEISDIITQSGLSKDAFAKLCGVSRTAVGKWCEGSIPSGRDDFIRIGFAARYDLEQMNSFLRRCGKYPALYSKSLEDSVYIYVLNSTNCPHTYSFCEDTITAIKARMETLDDSENAQYDTWQLSSELAQVNSIAELSNFIVSHAADYKNAYAKFYAYVNAFLIANNTSVVDGKVCSVNSLANAQNWTSSLRQSVSEIRNKKWFPLRRKVIALGLHLNMATEQINEMLGLAQMEPLCAKNPVESAILYAVEDADLNEMICCDGGMELCEHVHSVLNDLGIEGVEQLLNDL